ncbi:MAG: hypothetical protein IJC73_09160 [Lentisphaeria bacterium]|nr:hypothetical protein [Lentisphaeria bacterium]
MPPEKTSFAAAFAGACRGRAIFPRLLRQSMWRAFAHLLLMVLLCSVAGTIVRCWDTRSEIRRQADRFSRTFGEIVIGDQWVIPAVDPAATRMLLYPELIRIFYSPSCRELQAAPGLTAPGESGEPYFFWLPRQIMMLQPAGNDKFLFTEFSHTGSVTDCRTLSWEEFRARLAAQADNSGPLPDPAAAGAVRVNAGQMMTWMMGGVFFGWLTLEQCTSLLMFLVFFIGLFSLLGGPSNRTMTYRENLLTGIYASLPVLPVACCFPVFDLPLLPFSTAYLFGTMGYFLFIVNYIEFSRRNGGNNLSPQNER